MKPIIIGIGEATARGKDDDCREVLKRGGKILTTPGAVIRRSEVPSKERTLDAC
jgi:hypothetical protein